MAAVTPSTHYAAALDDALVSALDAVLPRYLRLLRHALSAAEGDDRLTLSQLRCLQLLAEPNGPALPSRLARALRVTPPTMTRMIDALVERGFVERQPDPVNRRQIGLVLTPAGRISLARYEQVMRDRLRGLLDHLSEAAKRRLLAATMDIAAMLDADERAGEARA
jgi:DNA-binding MarR family transcriptional regulator